MSFYDDQHNYYALLRHREEVNRRLNLAAKRIMPPNAPALVRPLPPIGRSNAAPIASPAGPQVPTTKPSGGGGPNLGNIVSEATSIANTASSAVNAVEGLFSGFGGLSSAVAASAFSNTYRGPLAVMDEGTGFEDMDDLGMMDPDFIGAQDPGIAPRCIVGFGFGQDPLLDVTTGQMLDQNPQNPYGAVAPPGRVGRPVSRRPNYVVPPGHLAGPVTPPFAHPGMPFSPATPFAPLPPQLAHYPEQFHDSRDTDHYNHMLHSHIHNFDDMTQQINDDPYYDPNAVIASIDPDDDTDDPLMDVGPAGY
jgi:hypothetical protein